MERRGTEPRSQWPFAESTEPAGTGFAGGPQRSVGPNPRTTASREFLMLSLISFLYRAQLLLRD